MSRTHYQIYKEQTFVLAKTLIVKHEEIASSMNTELYYRGYVIDSNPYNWRYYLNLSGEYHQADKDELYEQHGTEYIMVKLPSDSGPVDVPLTKELLHGENADKAMMNEYQIGSKFYTELVSRYPNFETLIIGILNPIEKSVAVKADNGEILFVAGRYKKIQGDRKWFDTTWYSLNEVLIEPQEDNLIFELQRYISTFLRHWNNPEYIEGNDLYAVTMLGVLYCNIPNAIFNIRLGNCKTVRAHTFHIRQYLESHGQIGRYVDFIPIASALWLYRNIEYLEANTGKQLTFDSIMDNVLTPNEIPMSAYSIRHELSNMGDDKLLPTGMLYKETLNFEVVGASDDDRTVMDILEDQVGLARDNHKDLDIKEVTIQDTLDWGGDDRINTKVLESEMMELGEPYPFTLAQFLINMWGYTAIKGYYTGSAFATNPLTGDRMSFSSRNAYILAHYCLNKGVAGIELDRIPTVRLYQIPKTNQPNDLPSDKTFGLKPDINKIMSWCVSSKTRRLKALEVVGTHIPNFYAQDSESFFNNVHDVYDERVRRYNTYCDVEEVEERGDLELVAKRMYWVNFQETILDMSYENWFRTVGFNPEQFNDNDLLNLGLELIASATGVVEQDDIRKKWLQKSLLAIMKHFISYTVHVIEKFSDGVVTYLEGQTIRYSDFKWSYIDGLPVKYNIAIDYSTATLLKQRMRVDVSNAFENAAVDVNATVNAGYDLSNLAITQTAHKLNVGTYALSAEISNIEFNTEKAEPVFIVVIDNVVNTFVIGGMNAVIKDDSRFFKHVTKDGLSLKPISALALDAFVSTNGVDTNRDTTLVVKPDILARDSKRSAVPKVDTQSLKPSSFSAIITDASIKIANVIDSMGHVIKDVAGNAVDELTDYAATGRDLASLGLNYLSAGIKDSNILLGFKDAHQTSVSVTKVQSLDPQIPGVNAPSDSHSATISNISGSNAYANIDYTSSDTSSMVLFDIGVYSQETDIEFDMAGDSAAVTMGNISVSSSENNIAPVMSDTYHSLTVSDISVDVTDTSTEVVVVDSNSIETGNLELTITDDSIGKGVTDDTINVNDIVIDINDEAVPTIVANDVDRVNVSDVTISVVDVTQTADTNDINAIDVTQVALESTDVDTTVNVVDTYSNTINLTDIKLSRSDEATPYGTSDTTGMTIDSIAINSRDANITTSGSDYIATALYTDGIGVDILEDEIRKSFGDSLHVNVIPNQITMEVIEHDITNLNVENIKTTLDVNDVQLTITDADDSITITPVIDVNQLSIDVSSISLDNIETITVNAVSDSDKTVLDITQVSVEFIETLNVSALGESNQLVINASDVTVDVINTLSVHAGGDNDQVTIEQIQIRDNVDDIQQRVTDTSTDATVITAVRIETKDAVDHIVMTDNNGVSITNVTGSRTDVALKADSSVDGSNIIINATNVDINIVDE